MEVKQARNLKTLDFVKDDTRFYQVKICKGNPHDIWFWHCKVKSKALIVRDGGKVSRVYLGSKNLKHSNLKFLRTLQTS